MFKNTRKVLDDFEKAYNNIIHRTTCDIPPEDEDTIQYFSVHLAKALMQDEYIPASNMAKIILAAKDLSSDIIVKVQ